MSRNKREGKYVGCVRGKHVRGHPKTVEFVGETYLEDASWPGSSEAWCKMYDRGTICTLYKVRYVSKKMKAYFAHLD